MFAEYEVAMRLQASRTPVREALMQLQIEGLVHGHFRYGWEVVSIDFSCFPALYELREMNELHAVRRLCETTTPTVLTKLGAPRRVAPNKRLRDGLAVAALDERVRIMGWLEQVRAKMARHPLPVAARPKRFG